MSIINSSHPTRLIFTVRMDDKTNKMKLFELRANISRNIYVYLGAGFMLFLLCSWQIITSAELVRPLFLGVHPSCLVTAVEPATKPKLVNRR